MRTHLLRGLVGSAALAMMVGAVAAQPFEWGRGQMMGPGMMGPGRMGGGLCSPRAAGLAEWRVESIERAVRPTDAQKGVFDALKAASAKAAELIAAACPQDFPNSPSERLASMEKRLGSMLEAIRIVRPAFDSFYASLSEEQKKKLTSAGPRRWGWRNWR